MPNVFWHNLFSGGSYIKISDCLAVFLGVSLPLHYVDAIIVQQISDNIVHLMIQA